MFIRCVIVLFLAAALSGCGLPLRSGILPAATAFEPTPGMRRSAVSALMADTVVVGYEVDPVTGGSRPVEAKSLYSSEIFFVDGQEYLVDSYITGVARSGQPVSESILTPMIFRNDVLIGKGRDALAAVKAGRSNEK